MMGRTNIKCMTGAGLLALALLTGASQAGAQAAGSGDEKGKPDAANTPAPPASADKRVTINVDDVTLIEALRTLLKSGGISYVIDKSVQDARVTAHLTDVRLSLALDALLQSSDPPITYSVENGIYRFVAHEETPAPVVAAPLPTPPRPAAPKFKVEKIPVQYVDAGALADFLNGTSFTVGAQPFGLVDPDAAFNSQSGAINGSRSSSNSGFINGNIFNRSGGALLGNTGNGYGKTSQWSSGGGFNLGPFRINGPGRR